MSLLVAAWTEKSQSPFETRDRGLTVMNYRVGPIRTKGHSLTDGESILSRHLWTTFTSKKMAGSCICESGCEGRCPRNGHNSNHERDVRRRASRDCTCLL